VTEVTVWRQEPGARGERVKYHVEAPAEGMVVDALFAVQIQHDPSFAFRVACRAGICGSCAVRIDGREGLACQVPLVTVGNAFRVEPLRHLPVLRDLVVDLGPFFGKYGAVHPEFRPRADLKEPAHITAAERGLVERAINCISCGSCWSACDVVGLNPGFLGPAALARAWALVADDRDRDAGSRLRAAGSRDGVWRCHSLGACTTVCPKAVAPSLAIQALRRRALSPR
jgi:succinate dehydrogenase/fumarate reductase iron-sulfur protein